MDGLTTDQVCSAAQLFLNLAYPAGENTIPPARRIGSHLPPGEDFAEYLSRNSLPPNIFQLIKDRDGNLQGYSFRLGSSHFPHLKMKILQKKSRSGPAWVFAVDTHDAFARDMFRPPEGHPDAEKWIQLQTANAQLKQEIERAWDDAGLLTFNGLLRRELAQPAAEGERK